jgi:ferritin-like metal-binding protein YciE
MNLFTSKEFDSFQTLFIDQLQDLYDAETRLTKALPQMEDAASSQELKNAFRQHLGETQNQVTRLEQIFQQLGETPGRETCEAMKGLVKEGDEIVQASGDPDVKDAALIAAAQRVEHYEISGYGTARNFAHRLGRDDIARLLEETLEEEKHADVLLTQIAEQSVNVAARQA